MMTSRPETHRAIASALTLLLVGALACDGGAPSEQTFYCTDDTECKTGRVCHPVSNTCVKPEAVADGARPRSAPAKLGVAAAAAAPPAAAAPARPQRRTANMGSPC